MKLHGNARTCLHSRRLIVRRLEEQSWPLAQAAEAAGVSVRTASKWRARYLQEGEQGLLDRGSAPGSIPHRTSEERTQAIAALRRLRLTGAQIAELLRMPLSTVSAILTRIGLGRLSALEPREPANRYEKQRPGELVHIDVKKLGRISGAGHRVTAIAASRGAGTTASARPAGSSCTWPSTTRPGSPTSRCSRTRRVQRRPASCAARSSSSQATGCPSSGC